MRRGLVLFVGLVLFTMSGIAGQKQGQQIIRQLPLDGVPGVTPKTRDNSHYLPNHVIIKLMPQVQASLSKSALGISSVDRVLSRAAGLSASQLFPNAAATKRTVDIDLSLIYTVSYSSPNDPFTLAEELSRLPEVQYAEPWFIYPLAQTAFTPNDSLYEQQWSLRKINAPEAWNITKGDTTIVIAIVDSGVEWTHPDLAANIWTNPGETGFDAQGRDKRTNGIDDDGNGYVDDWHGWDLVGAAWESYIPGTTKGDNNPTATGSNNDHGTHVAGIAAAVTNNRIGVASLASNCRLLPVKCSADNDARGSGSAYVLAGYQGIVYAATMGTAIINCSWGGDGGSQVEQDVIDFATRRGSLIVAAAVNNQSDKFFSPGSYRGALSVAATNQSDVRAWFSNFGDNVDVCAPGVSIINTLYPRTYASLDGTSMASPLVASLAALVRGAFPKYSSLQIGEQLRVTCDDISAANPSFASRLGRGRINALRALTVTNLPSVRLQSYSVSDALAGNGNGYAEPGESVDISCTFRNYLAPTSPAAVITISTDSPYLTVTQSTFALSVLGTLDTIATSAFRMRVLQNVPQSYTARVKVTLVDGSFTDSQFLTFYVNPTFGTQDVNAIRLTLANNGRLGYYDYPENKMGVGFIFDGRNHLFEGGLILGTSSQRVVDVVRNQTAHDADFFSQDFYTLRTPGIVSDQDGFTSFTDSAAPATSRIGLRVSMHSYAFSGPVDSKYIILAYDVKNTTSSPITNLYAGIFLDWDIGSDTGLVRNYSRYDAGRSLGYSYCSLPGEPKAYFGIRALDTAAHFCSLVNDGSIDLSRGAKWKWISGEFTTIQAGPADIHHVLSAGPFNIGAGATRTIPFALVAGDSSLQNLQENADAAKRKWLSIKTVVGVEREESEIPSAYKLEQNYPNPSNPGTAISFQLPAPSARQTAGGPGVEGSAVSYVRLEVFDILGRQVAVLADEPRSAGRQTVHWDGSSMPSGVYFYRLTVSEASNKSAVRYVESRKMLLLR